MKYELTYETKVLETGEVLHRIRALEDFGNVKAGELGGWIEHEMNLSIVGKCWVGEEACVYGHAIVSINSVVHGAAHVYGHAGVIGESEVYGQAKVYDDALVFGNALVFGGAAVFGNAQIRDHALVFGNARVFENAQICENAKAYGDAKVGKDIQAGGTQAINEEVTPPNPLDLSGVQQKTKEGFVSSSTGPWIDEMKVANYVKWSEIRQVTLSDVERIKSDAFVFIIGTLVARRKELGMSQIDLAAKVGITQANLSLIESGDAIPGLDTIYKLGVALGMDFRLVPKN